MLIRGSVALLLLITCAIAAHAAGVPLLYFKGMDQVRNAQYREAIGTATALQRTFPDQPFSSLLAIEAYWGLIYCETGHINEREIWNLADVKTSPYDEDYFQAIDAALKTSAALREDNKSDRQALAATMLYDGMARGARARIFALREQTMSSAGEAKRMRSDLLEAVKADPNLSTEAGFGLGTYNYYTDALSPILKFFRFLLRIPGGSRKRGLEQLRSAALGSALWHTEAKFELARILGVREGDHKAALELFEQLAGEFPNNPLYSLSAAYQAEQVGNESAAIQLAGKAASAASRVSGACGARWQQASKGALERMQK